MRRAVGRATPPGGCRSRARAACTRGGSRSSSGCARTGSSPRSGCRGCCCRWPARSLRARCAAMRQRCGGRSRPRRLSCTAASSPHDAGGRLRRGGRRHRRVLPHPGVPAAAGRRELDGAQCGDPHGGWRRTCRRATSTTGASRRRVGARARPRRGHPRPRLAPSRVGRHADHRPGTRALSIRPECS